MEVLGRLSIGPRQGISVVSIEGRRLAISSGDGGVRLITELDSGPQNTEFETELNEAHIDATPSSRAHRRSRIAALSVMIACVLIPRVGFGQTVPPPVVDPPQAAQVEESLPDPQALFLELTESFLSEQEGGGLRLPGPMGVVVFMAFLTVIPTLVVLMTSFTRILVVLFFLRQALGTQAAPPGHLITALALLLSAVVMRPTLDEMNQTALQPWFDGEIEQAEMLGRAQLPFRDFMLSQVRPIDLEKFMAISGDEPVSSLDEIPLMTLTSAFVTNELRRAFQIGFALFMPFLVIDLVVASVLMSMGMFMLPPVMVSLPLKLVLFVLIDGWSLIIDGLVRSF